MQVYAFDLMPWPHLAEPSYYPDSNRLFDPGLGRQVYDEHFRQMELYEECGYDAVCINEHHAKPYGLMPSPNLIAAVLTQRTKRIKIGIFGNLPALHANPVRLAEEVAMLDVMSGGRIISGFVRGVPQEFLAYSVPLADARPRLTEAWDLIVKAWTERQPFQWRGKYFDYDRVSIWPRPLQEPHPPRPAQIEKAEDVPLYEIDFDLCQREGLTIIGDPDHVVREIQGQARELGVGVLVGRFQFGSLPHALALKNIRLFSEKVLPALRRG